MASQEAAAVEGSLESRAKEVQDYGGGGRGKSSVVNEQVDVPSEGGEKADEEIRFLKNENSKLRVQLKDCEEAFQLANHETEKSNKVGRERKQKIEVLEKENEELKKNVQAVGEKVAKLELKLRDSEDRNKSVIKELEAKVKRDEQSKAALSGDIDRLKPTIHDREVQLRSLDEEIATKEKTLKRRLLEKNIAVEELSSKAEHFESRAIPAEKKASELDSKAVDLSAKASGVEADLSHERAVNEQKEASIAEYQEEIHSAVKRANRIGAALRAEEEKADAVKAEAEEQRSRFEERAITAEEEAGKLRKKSDEDAAHARVLAERIDALEKMITATKDHSMESNKVLEGEGEEGAEERSITETEANDLNTQRGGLLSTIVDLKSKMFGAASKAEERDAEAKTKTEQAEETGEALDAVKDEAGEADTAATEELKQTDSKLGEMDQSLQSSGQRLADLGEKLTTLREERDEAVATAEKVEDLNARNTSLETELQHREQHIVKLENQLQEVGVKIEKQ